VSSKHRVADQETIRENKLALVERLADDLAHEIKNPLHSMVINLEVLRRRIARLEGDSNEDLLRYAGVLNAELERVSRRVELLLRLVRPNRESEDEATLAEGMPAKILIADDERHIAEGLADAPRRRRLRGRRGRRRSGALGDDREGGYALVLADLRMPEVDGLELFSRMREAGSPAR
jgi:signal transduction histidine kinase